MMDLLLYSVSKPSIRLVYISLLYNSVYCWRDSPFLRQRMICTSPPSPSLPSFPPSLLTLLTLTCSSLFSKTSILPCLKLARKHTHTHTHIYTPAMGFLHSSSLPAVSKCYHKTSTVYIYDQRVCLCVCVRHRLFWHGLASYAHSPFPPDCLLKFRILVVENLWVKWWLTMNIYDQRCVSGV